MTHVFMDWESIAVDVDKISGKKVVLFSVLDASKKTRIWLKMRPKTAIAIGKGLIKAGKKAKW